EYVGSKQNNGDFDDAEHDHKERRYPVTNKNTSDRPHTKVSVSRRGLLLGAGGDVGGGLAGAAAGYAAAPAQAPVAPGDPKNAVAVSSGIANTQVTVAQPYGTATVQF